MHGTKIIRFDCLKLSFLSINKQRMLKGWNK
jgi:hypothetical protein